MSEAANTETNQRTLQSLSVDEKRSDLYVTAIHELERRRQNWSVSRLEKIASELGLDKRLLALTWCLFQAVSRTRRKSAPVRLSVSKAYGRLVGGIHKPVQNNGLPEGALDSARECLLAAGWAGFSARRSVDALLTGQERELRIRETTEFVDVTDSDEESDADPVMRLSRAAVTSLPGVDNVSEGSVSDVVQRVAELARRVGAGEAVCGMSTEAGRMARHRCKAVEWVSRCGRTDAGRDMGKVIDEIGDEAGVRLHPLTKRVLRDTFREEGCLSDGGLASFRALVPDRFLRAVREREVRRLVGIMKSGDTELAEQLVSRFGSAERCLRGDVQEVGESVMELVHGFDGEFHGVLEGRVREIWVVARVMKDKFGDIGSARRAGFWRIVGGGDEVVELTRDERVGFYEAVHDAVKRKEFLSMWGLFKAMCEMGVEDCVGCLGRLIAEFGEECVLNRLVDADLRLVCSLIGINSDAMHRLRQVTRDMLCENPVQ